MVVPPKRSVGGAQPSRLPSIVFTLTGIGVLIAALVAPVVMVVVSGSGAWLGLSPLFASVGLWCFRFARQARLRGAAAALANDPRPPVVYLRAFTEDSSRSRLTDWPRAWVPWQQGYFEQMRGGLPFDFMIRSAIERVLGPFIAFGKPGDRLIPFGAARLYEPEDDWQDAVRDLVKRAVAILVLGVRSEGVIWELQMVRGESDPWKLFILTPPEPRAVNEGEWRAFVEAAGEFGCVLPLDNPGPGAVLVFDKEWTARVAVTGASTAETFVAAIVNELGAHRGDPSPEPGGGVAAAGP